MAVLVQIFDAERLIADGVSDEFVVDDFVFVAEQVADLSAGFLEDSEAHLMLHVFRGKWTVVEAISKLVKPPPKSVVSNL